MGGIIQVDTIQNNNTSTIITQTNTTTITIARSGQTIVIPSGTTFNASSASVNLPSINLATGVTGTLPYTSGGTGLTTLGTAGQALVVNSGATALQYSTVGATAGQVLQVVSTTKSDTFSSSTANAFTDITGLSVSITPSSASNKILIIANVQAQNNNTNGYLRLVRGATAIGVGDTAGSRSSVSGSNMYSGVGSFFGTNAFQFLDSPATTSSTTYKIQFITDGPTTFINRSSTDTDFLYIGRSQSTITVMEIKG